MGIETRNCRCGQFLGDNENIYCASCREKFYEIIEEVTVRAIAFGGVAGS